jgi:hypothetical protein
MSDLLDQKIRSTVVELMESSPPPHPAHKALKTSIPTTSPLPFRSGLARLVTAAVVVLLVGLGVVWLTSDLTSSDVVAVPTVEGVPSPEPGFDVFGREVRLLPSTGRYRPEVPRATLQSDAVAIGQIEGTDLEVFKWETVDGEICVQVVGPDFRDTQCSDAPAGGPDPTDPLDGAEPFITAREDETGGTEVISVWRVPEETSVVLGSSAVGGVADSEDRFWQRPVSGVSAFVFASDTTRVTFDAEDTEQRTVAIAFFSPRQIVDPVQPGETQLEGSPRDLVQLDASNPVNQILAEGVDDMESFVHAADERGLRFNCGGGRGGGASHSLCLVGLNGTLIVVPFGDAPGLSARIRDLGLVEDVVVPLDRTEPVGITNLAQAGRDVQVEYFGEEIGALSRPNVATLGRDACLVGGWVLDNESFLEGYRSLLVESGMDDAEVEPLPGLYTIDMHNDGTFDATRDEWGYSVTTGGDTYVLVVSGTETGTWSTDGSTINITTDVSNVTVEVSREIDGERIPLPGQSPFEAPSIATTSDYSCSADVVTVTTNDIAWVMHRG